MFVEKSIDMYEAHNMAKDIDNEKCHFCNGEITYAPYPERECGWLCQICFEPLLEIVMETNSMAARMSNKRPRTKKTKVSKKVGRMSLPKISVLDFLSDTPVVLPG